jgi:Skp family chaperone for outer membrane proteins
MLRVLLLCLGLILALSGSGAEGPKEPPAKTPTPQKPAAPGPVDNFGELLLPRIEEKLKLDPDQKEQLASLRREFKDKCTDVRDETQAAVEKIRAAAKKEGRENDRATKRQLTAQTLEMMQRYRKLVAEYEPRLRALLTDPQKALYDELRKEKPRPMEGTKTDGKKETPRKNGDKGPPP